MMTRMRTRMNRQWHPIWYRHLMWAAAVVVAVALSIGSALPAAAAEAGRETGTLTILPSIDDTILDADQYDGTFDIYEVADYDVSGQFTLTNGFEDYDGIGIGDETFRDEARFKELTQALDDYLGSHSGSKVYREDVPTGQAVTLPYGLYLVRQHTRGGGYEPCNAFLAMIPAYSENTTERHVTAYCKLERTPDIPDEPHKPHEPSTPIYGHVSLRKVDTDDNRIILPGVSFTLYKVSYKEGTEDSVVGNYVTDDKGTIAVYYLAAGDYYWRETETLEDYQLDTRPHRFSITTRDTVSMVVTNTRNPEPEIIDESHQQEYTGDNSPMLLYGAIAATAAVLLGVWFLVRRRRGTDRK